MPIRAAPPEELPLARAAGWLALDRQVHGRYTAGPCHQPPQPACPGPRPRLKHSGTGARCRPGRRTPPVAVTNRDPRSCGTPVPCLLPVCSDAPVRPGSTRHSSASHLAGCRYQMARSGITWYENNMENMFSSRLLIRWFGVQVPGGAPVLSWGYILSGWPRGGRFGGMFARRLLVSPDLVVRAGQHAR
jgi:hypothetical protein